MTKIKRVNFVKTQCKLIDLVVSFKNFYAIDVYLVEGFLNETCHKYSPREWALAEEVFKVRGQRSRS